MKTVHPGSVSGHLNAPPSKSMAQRAIAIAALINGESTIRMGTPCDDIRSAMEAATGLGALISPLKDGISVCGDALEKKREISCGEAGLSLRMFCAIAALFPEETVLVAGGSLAHRPVEMVTAPLLALGASCRTEKGLPPITVKGPIRGGAVEVDGTTSSQFLTGLLIALSRCKDNSRITARGLKSKPYVQMTLDLLNLAGARIIAASDLEFFEVEGGAALAPFDYRVPGDWSGASFPLVAAAVAGRVTVSGLDMASSQADRAICEALQLAGAYLHTEGERVTVERRPLRSFDFDATHCPDLFPPLVALAASAQGVSHIAGVHRLGAKESNREQALISEFGALGVAVSVEADVMRVEGGSAIGARVDSHSDHRIAMATAVAALLGQGPVSISDAHCINKSYPDFFTDLQTIGVTVS